MRQRIYYHHTDCGGVVYYANYLNFLEEARTEYLEKAGATLTELQNRGILFVVARQEIDYKFPAVYGDILDIKTWINNISAVKIEFENEIRNQSGQVTTKAKTILVCIGKDFKPSPIPDDLRSGLLKLGE